MTLRESLQEWYDEHMKALVEKAMQQNEQEHSSDFAVLTARLVQRKTIMAQHAILKDLQVEFDLTPYADEKELKFKCPICEGELTENGCQKS